MYVSTTITKTHTEQAAAQLQSLVQAFMGLTIDAKLAHWNVVGKQFVAVHEYFDRVADDARAWADLVAERCVTLGTPVECTAHLIGAQITATQLSGKFTSCEVSLGLIAEHMRALDDQCRTAVDTLGQCDIVSQGIVVEVLQALEKHLWTIEAQLQ